MITKVTKDAVEEAIKKITEEGKKVTPTEIHRITGGSRTTVYKVLADINQNKMETAMDVAADIADEVIGETATDAVKKIYDVCWKKAQDIAVASYKAQRSNDQDVIKILDHLDTLEINAKLKEELYKAKEGELKAIIAQKEAEINMLKAENQMFRDRLTNLGGKEQATPGGR